MNKFMTKKEAEQEFKGLYNNDLSRFKHDRPGIRQAWNDFTDYLCKDGRISDKQYHNWTQPVFVSR
jgi:hypothetical protein